MVRKKRPGKSAKYRLFLVASRTDLPNVSQPVDILLAHQWNETGLNTRQLRPGLLGLADFRYHIAAALIPSTVWNNPELSFLQRFKEARYFEHLGKTEHQISDNTWEERDILKTVAIEECGWTGESLENVTNNFNVILWNCWPGQKKPYYNPLWWNCHDVAMLLIYILDESGTAARKLPRIYRVLHIRRDEIHREIENRIFSPMGIAGILNLSMLPVTTLLTILEVSLSLGMAPAIGALGIGLEAGSAVLAVANPIIAGLAGVGMVGVWASTLCTKINATNCLKKRGEIFLFLEQSLPRLKEVKPWLVSDCLDASRVLTESFRLYAQWVAVCI